MIFETQIQRCIGQSSIIQKPIRSKYALTSLHVKHDHHDSESESAE